MVTNQLFVKATGLPKCKTACCNNRHAELQETAAKRDENKVIHEHDFIAARIKEDGFFLVHCTSCGIYYCKLCGKAL